MQLLGLHPQTSSSKADPRHPKASHWRHHLHHNHNQHHPHHHAQTSWHNCQNERDILTTLYLTSWWRDQWAAGSKCHTQGHRGRRTRCVAHVAPTVMQHPATLQQTLQDSLKNVPFHKAGMLIIWKNKSRRTYPDFCLTTLPCPCLALICLYILHD